MKSSKHFSTVPTKPILLFQDFIKRFAMLNINVNEEINDWFNAINPGYEHPCDQGIVELLTALENVEGMMMMMILPILKFNSSKH